MLYLLSTLHVNAYISLDSRLMLAYDPLAFFLYNNYMTCTSLRLEIFILRGQFNVGKQKLRRIQESVEHRIIVYEGLRDQLNVRVNFNLKFM